MDALWIDVPEDFLEERHQHGKDRRDELWEGVLHMVPTPSTIHINVAAELFVALRALAGRHRLVAYPDPIGIYAPETDPMSWRVPDAALARPEQVSERGLEGTVLAVEVLSPRDKSREKFPFYARVGLSEVWLVDPKTRESEVYTIVDGAFALLPPVAGVHRSPLLGISLEVIKGPKLLIRDGDSLTEI